MCGLAGVQYVSRSDGNPQKVLSTDRRAYACNTGRREADRLLSATLFVRLNRDSVNTKYNSVRTSDDRCMIERWEGICLGPVTSCCQQRSGEGTELEGWSMLSRCQIHAWWAHDLVQQPSTEQQLENVLGCNEMSSRCAARHGKVLLCHQAGDGIAGASDPPCCKD